MDPSPPSADCRERVQVHHAAIALLLVNKLRHLLPLATSWLMVGHVVQQFCWSRTWEAPQEHCEVLMGLFHRLTYKRSVLHFGP